MTKPKRQNPPPVGQPIIREAGFTPGNNSSKQNNNNTKKNKP